MEFHTPGGNRACADEGFEFGRGGCAARPGWSVAGGLLALFAALLALPLQAQEQSDDATLDHVRLRGTSPYQYVNLSPSFDSDTFTYTASAANRLDEVLLFVTPSDDDASFVVTSSYDTSPERFTVGADRLWEHRWISEGTEGARLNLDVGSNTVTVTVTAEDSTTQTYTMVVTRAAAPPAPTDCPEDTDWCTTMRVGHYHDRIGTGSDGNQRYFDYKGYLGYMNMGDFGSRTFTHGVNEYEVKRLDVVTYPLFSPYALVEELYLGTEPNLPVGTVLQVGADTFTVATEPELQTTEFSNPPAFTEGQHVTVSLKLPEPKLTAAFESALVGHDGSGTFKVDLKFSKPLSAGSRAKLNDLLTVSGGTLKRVRRVNKQRDHWRLRVRPSALDAVTVSLTSSGECSDGALCTEDGETLSNAPSTTIEALPGLSVADAQIQEAAGAVLTFRVTLDRQVLHAVTVDFATSDGTATAGEDYTAAGGTLTFAACETEKTVTVAVLDDAPDEGSETLTLTLSNASGAHIADDSATGTITNSDPMPQAWLARFGRTIASQAIDAIGGQIAGGGGMHMTVGGQRLSLAGEPDAAGDVASVLGTLFSTGEDGDPTPSMTERELLLGSSFQLSAGGETGAPAWSAWGRFSTGGFDAEVDETRLNGTVTTGFLGADVDTGRWLGGVALSSSKGDGDYALIDGADRGDVESSLTALYPYARLRLTDDVAVWGLAGYGTGELALHGNPGTERARTYRPDISMRMVGLGARGEVVTPSRPSGLAVAVKSDAFWVGTTSERVAGLMGSEAEVSRARLGMEGSRTFDVGGAALTPSLELGLRHDAGDAETGTGIEAVAGVRYTSGAVTAEAAVNTLFAHEDASYEEWGASGTLRIDPGQSGRGLSLNLSPSWGGATHGANRLWSLDAAQGLSREPDIDAGRRLDARLAYGIGVPENRGVVTPYTGLSLADGGAHTVRAGVRWNVAPGAVLGVEGTRDEGAGANTPANAIRFQTRLRW